MSCTSCSRDTYLLLLLFPGTTPGQSSNTYFTYEIHTYVEYNAASGGLTGPLWTFASSDDLWVYINGKLVPDWDLGGIHPLRSISVPVKTHAAFLGLEDGGIYRCDIFYAHRSAKRQFPHLTLQLPKAVLCNALSSGETKVDFKFNVTSSTYESLDGTSLQVSSSIKETSGQYGITLINTPSDQTSLYATDNQDTPVPLQLKVLQGFECTFDFSVGTELSPGTGSSEGFAFVIQSFSPSASGRPAFNLGYGGLEKSLAIEFDMNENTETGDPSYQHVSVHAPLSDPGAPNSAHEDDSIGRSLYDPNNKFGSAPQLRMDNGTVHSVRITYSPAKQDSDTGAKLGWIRVYMNKVIRPICEVQVDGVLLRNLLGPASFVGFTAGSSSAKFSPIYIRNWKMKVVPPSAQFMEMMSFQGLRAGLLHQAYIQTKDTCANDFVVGEEPHLFDAQFAVNDVPLRARRSGAPSDGPSADVEYSFESLHDGRYRLDFKMYVAGSVNLAVTYTGTAISDQPVALVIPPGPIDTDKSSIEIGERPVLYNNVLEGDRSRDGLFVVIVSATGNVAGEYFYSVGTDFIAPDLDETDIVAAAIQRDASPLMKNEPLLDWFETLGSNAKTFSFETGSSWAFIGSKKEGISPKETFRREGGPTDLLTLQMDGFKVVGRSDGMPTSVALPRVYINALPDATRYSFRAGETAHIAFVHRDSFNNLIQPVDGDIQGSFSVDTDHDYTYHAQLGYSWLNFQAAISSTFQVSALFNTDKHIRGSPADIKIIAGQAVAANSLAFLRGVVTGGAGDQSMFSLQLYDSLGNQVLTQKNAEKNSIAAVFSHKLEDYSEQAELVWNDRAYDVKYTLLQTGMYDVSVEINGETMPLDGFEGLQIIAGSNSPAHATYSDQSFTNAQASAARELQTTALAGQTTTIWIQTRDKFGGARNSPSTEHSISFADNAVDGTHYRNARAYYVSEGVYAVEFIPVLAGSDLSVSVTCGGQTVFQHQVTITPGVPSTMSQITINSGNSFRVGSDLDFSVSCMDSENNAVPNCDPTLFDAQASRNDIPSDVEVSVSTAQGSTLPGVLRTTISGTYIISLRLKTGAQTDDALISSSKIVITPLDTNFDKSLVFGPGASGGVASTKTQIFVQCRDEFENPQTHLTDAVTLKIANSPQNVQTSEDSPGLYTFEYDVPPAGSYTIEYMINSDSKIISATSVGDENGCELNIIPSIFSAAAGEEWPLEFKYSTNNYKFKVRLSPQDNSGKAIEFDVDYNVEKQKHSTVFNGLRQPGKYNLYFYALTYIPCTVWNGTAYHVVTVDVMPGKAFANLCEFKGLPTVVRALEQFSFNMILRDSFGSPIDPQTRDYKLTATLRNPGNGQTRECLGKPENSEFVFSCSWDSAGSILLSVDGMEGERTLTALGGYTPNLSVLAGQIVVAACRHDHPSEQVAGKSTSFTVFLNDGAGNRVTKLLPDKYNIEVQLNSEAPDSLTKTFNPDFGTFTVNYVPKTAGEAKLDVTLFEKGQSSPVGTIPDSRGATPSVVRIVAGDLDLLKSTITSGVNISAGTDANVTLEVVPKDALDNILDGVSIIAFATDPSGKTLYPNLTRMPNGGTRISLGSSEATLAGEYVWQLIIDSQAIPKENIPVSRVKPGQMDKMFSIFAAAKFPAEAAVPSEKTIILRDRFGNPIESSDELDVSDLSIIVKEPYVDCDIEDDGDGDELPQTIVTSGFDITNRRLEKGSIKFSWTTNKVGVFQFSISVGDTETSCQRSGRQVVVPGQIVVSETILEGDEQSRAGEDVVIDVRLRDVAQNRIYDSDCQFESKFALRVTMDGVSSEQPVTLSVTCLPDSDKSKTYRLSFQVQKMARLSVTVLLRLSSSGSPVTLGQVARNIVPATLTTFTIPPSITARSGEMSSFELVATDSFDNPVSSVDYSFLATFTKFSEGNNKPIYQTLATSRNGTIEWKPYTAGNMTCTVQLMDSSGVELAAKTLSVTVGQFLCPADTPFRCQKGTGQCASSYDECTDIQQGPKCSGNKTLCTTGPQKCVLASECPCPDGQTRCPSGQCAASPQCHIVSSGACPSFAPFECQSNGKFNGHCRATMKDCPATKVCPPGYSLCPDGVSCVDSASAACPSTSSCPTGMYVCFDGTCSQNYEDCPTPSSCPDGGAVCPDGSCQSSSTKCPSIYPCPSEEAHRCPDGSCRPSKDSCPVTITCPHGFARCPNNECVLDVTACNRNGTSLRCPAGYFRCPDGACLANLLECASVASCPPESVQCSDGSCAGQGWQCPPPNACPSDLFRCPDGSCVSTGACPTRTKCPHDSPILCTDGRCVNTTTQCQRVVSCPQSSPVRCPGGACRGNLDDCPDAVTCPLERPVKCADGYCASAITECVPTDKLDCPSSKFRCVTGECVDAAAFCPVHISCPDNTARCEDGTCRIDCSAIIAISRCPVGTIQCPQYGTGRVCATNLQECPQATFCPVATPVRCFDGTCETSTSTCQTPPKTYDTGLTVPCTDGSWAADGGCSSPITCPPSSPFLCSDFTCRVVPDDCPSVGRCPASKPYRCGASCVEKFSDPLCSSSGISCPPSQPFRCPTSECKSSPDECPVDRSAKICDGKTLCRDGSCSSECPSFQAICKATIYVPYACPDGMCALSKDRCNDRKTGCPWDRPFRCISSGACVEDLSRCQDSRKACPRTSCYGFCLNENQCQNILANQCPNEAPIRCFDRKCVRDFSECTEATREFVRDPANTCPTDRPYKCPNGYCSLASNRCPTVPSAHCLGTGRSTACADGSCAASADFCPTVAPCLSTEKRCPDGSCRDKDFVLSYGCPESDTCSTVYKNGGVRCDDGLCAPSNSHCVDSSTGCPGANSFKCPNGACVVNEEMCPALTATGCKDGRKAFKCWDGECVASPNDCRNKNGCREATPIKCKSSNTCVSKAENCEDVAACDFKCADGSCVSRPNECQSLNNCNVTKPIRCADGSCAAYSAFADGATDKCRPQLVCEPGEVLCRSGSCAASHLYCPPVVDCEGVLCPDFTCVSKENECAQSARCPESQPLQCPTGECVRRISQCPGVVNSGLSVLSLQLAVDNANLPADAAVRVAAGCSTETPFKCFDGKCEKTPARCQDWKKKVVENGGNPCGENEALCPDGSCSPNSPGNGFMGPLCPILASCGPGQYRHSKGHCDTNAEGRPDACQQGLSRYRCRPRSRISRFGLQSWDNFCFFCVRGLSCVRWYIVDRTWVPF